MNLKRGFTLIELLVVIAIIGLLASVVLASMATIQARSRDTRRMTDMQGYVKALQLHVTSGGIFPIMSTTTITGTDALSTALQDAGDINKVPLDPLYPVAAYPYRYGSQDGLTYGLQFCLETSSVRGFTKGCNNFISN